ncbi:MAG: hypothetical protein H7263_18765 [Candidatus Sericytochromatia bacterium]|nr:hypothetical protein [Candidatus Sericytochromatia bacterium]
MRWIETRLQGIRLLRTFANQGVMLRYCYVVRGKTPDLISLIIESRNTLSPEKAREIYYQVTGKTFNTVAPPDSLKSRLQFSDNFIFDEDQAGDIVGGKLKKLGMSKSRLDGIIDQNAGIAYTEWTMVFKNSADFQQEARTQIKLSAGGTVSRLTLWINGQEREAAFGGKEKVKGVYKNIVSVRRAPVLVTSNGSDRVLMQCFPVPPSGEMKVRLGITYPLQYKNKKQANMSFPYFIERNFALNDNFKHAIWIDSKNPIVLADQKFELQHSKNIYTLRTDLNNEDIEKSHLALKLTIKQSITDSWAKDITDNKYIIAQKVNESKVKVPDRVVIVIDGSYSMKKYSQDIIDSLKIMNKNIDTKIVIADDQVIEKNSPDQIKDITFVGGHENSEALEKGIKLASEKENSSLIWLHGPQPQSYQEINNFQDQNFYILNGFYPSTSQAELFARYNLKNKVDFYETQLGDGDNTLVYEMSKIASLKSLPVEGNFKDSLKALLQSWDGKSNEIIISRKRINKSDYKDTKLSNVSSHLGRLWAVEEVKSLLNTHHNGQALKIANQYHIVTSISGAVVLENDQQYRDAGLKPVSQSSVPIIPEPEEWLMIIVTAMILLWLTCKRRNSSPNPFSSSFKG